MSLGPALAAGCDLEMPGPGMRARKLAGAVANGEVSEADVDLAASRVVRLARRAAAAESDLGDGPDPTDVAYRVAVSGMVLLKNEGDLLPLADATGSIAVLGPCADPGQIMGGGSSQVNPPHRISPVEGVRARAAGAEVRHEPGCDIRRWCPSIPARTLAWEGEPGVWFEVYPTPDLSGAPARAERARKLDARFFGAVEGIDDPSRLSARLRADLTPTATGPHRLGLSCAGSARVSVDGTVVVEQDSASDPGDSFYAWGSDEKTALIELEAGVAVSVEVEYRRADAQQMAGVGVGLAAPPDDASLEARGGGGGCVRPRDRGGRPRRLVGDRGLRPTDALAAGAPGRTGRAGRGREPADRRRAQRRQPGSDAVARPRARGPAGLVPGPGDGLRSRRCSSATRARPAACRTRSRDASRTRPRSGATPGPTTTSPTPRASTWVTATTTATRSSRCSRSVTG